MNEVIPTQNFRVYLQNELVRRTKANPRYSLRAFAKALDVQSGFLSKILLGQRRVTPATVRRFGIKLGLTPEQIDSFERACNGETAGIDDDFRQVAYDQFLVISDWYHFAILELSAVQGFDPSAKWISRALGISPAEAQAAIERLERLGYISIQRNGSWKPRDAHTTTLGTEETSAALRKMQKQILEMAISAMEEVPPALRDQSAMTMAIDSSLIPQAKERVKKFRRDLCAFLESGKKRDAVYQLSISLFPASKMDRSPE